jgi:hypothetical protein
MFGKGHYAFLNTFLITHYGWEVDDGGWISYIMNQKWMMINKFYSCNWKMNNDGWISSIMGEKWIVMDGFYA